MPISVQDKIRSRKLLFLSIIALWEMRFQFKIRWDNSKSISLVFKLDGMALCSPIPPPFSPSKSLLSLKSLKPLNPLLVFSESLRPTTHFVASKSRRVRVEATATLDSGNGAVMVAPEEESKISSINTYGRQYFPLAAVVGQVRTAALPQCVYVCAYVLHFEGLCLIIVWKCTRIFGGRGVN